MKDDDQNCFSYFEFFDLIGGLQEAEALSYK